MPCENGGTLTINTMLHPLKMFWAYISNCFHEFQDSYSFYLLLCQRFSAWSWTSHLPIFCLWLFNIRLCWFLSVTPVSLVSEISEGILQWCKLSTKPAFFEDLQPSAVVLSYLLPPTWKILPTKGHEGAPREALYSFHQQSEILWTATEAVLA